MSELGIGVSKDSWRMAVGDWSLPKPPTCRWTTGPTLLFYTVFGV